MSTRDKYIESERQTKVAFYLTWFQVQGKDGVIETAWPVTTVLPWSPCGMHRGSEFTRLLSSWYSEYLARCAGLGVEETMMKQLTAPQQNLLRKALGTAPEGRLKTYGISSVTLGILMQLG